MSDLKKVSVLRKWMASNYPDGVSLEIQFIPGQDLVIKEKKRNHRKNTPRFRVQYEDNTYSCDGRYEKGVRVLSDVIMRVSPEVVRSLGIISSGGMNLIQTEAEIIKSKSPIFLKPGYWFISKTSTAEKENQIRSIMEAQRVNWIIEHKK